LSITFFSCDSEPKENLPDVKWSLERADKAMVNAQSVEELQAYFSEHQRFGKLGMGLGLRPEGDGPFYKSMMRLANDPKIDSLYEKCENVYGEDLNELEQEFDEAFSRLKSYYTDFQPPNVYTVVTGLGYDLMLRDSLLIVGLDYYLGNEHFPVAPPDPYGVPLPKYIWQRYEPATIVPHSMLFLVNRYAEKDPADRRLINEMITWGKILYLAQKVMPEKSPHLLIGYTEQQWVDTEASAAQVYRFFVEQQLFFEAGREAKTKYIQERPFTGELSGRAPGRLGVWLGWKIVEAYMEKNPETSIQDLMAMQDAQKIFEESRYRP
ncbi:MAG: hypothetical protein AAF740_11640, partial [Bacteroidota bacterium]